MLDFYRRYYSLFRYSTRACQETNFFEPFRRANLQLQPEKCVFAKDKVTYLGLELSYRGIEALLDKVKAVKNFPIPDQLKTLDHSLV